MLKFNRKKIKSTLADFWGGHGLWRKIWLCIAAALILWVGSMYAIAQWYIHSQADKPLNLGATFIPSYARYLGVNPQQTMDALISDMGVKNFRLVSYWDKMEPAPGQYDFSELDWQFEKAEAAGATISLSIGLRQPRWPECHMPAWHQNQPQDVWYPKMKDFMQATIERYKNSPALISYQLENEYFNKVFGTCNDFDRERLIDEFNFVKSLDSEHPVIVSRSNNAIGIPLGQPQPDEYAVSVYKRVWDKNVTKRYFEYPFPAWFYGFLAGLQEIVKGKNMIVHELQAEPWLKEGYDIRNAPQSEINKSLTPQRLKDRFEYGEATGMKTIYLWGAEWWYQMKVNRNNSTYWEIAHEEFRQANSSN